MNELMQMHDTDVSNNYINYAADAVNKLGQPGVTNTIVTTVDAIKVMIKTYLRSHNG